MPRSSTTGLPFRVRRTDTGEFCCHRDVPAPVAASAEGEVELPWKGSIRRLEGRPTVKVTLATGDEATARIRWNRVHEQVEGLVQFLHLASGSPFGGFEESGIGSESCRETLNMYARLEIITIQGEVKKRW